jgi:hypothetical protein
MIFYHICHVHRVHYPHIESLTAVSGANPLVCFDRVARASNTAAAALDRYYTLRSTKANRHLYLQVRSLNPAETPDTIQIQKEQFGPRCPVCIMYNNIL